MTPRQQDRQTFRNEDLVLQVSTDVDPRVWDETKYGNFLDVLCADREFQKQAVNTTLRYLCGAKYQDLTELAKKNFDSNEEIQLRYGTWQAMQRHLQFPEQLACSIDLATGTGKSYVLYALAAILLAEGVVDRVLILCPSNTIESGLLEKFKDLASRSDLRDVLPVDSKIANPTIVNASESLVEGAICVENYHAVLEHVGSSIRDSLAGKGSRVAVFSDEAHHVATESAATIKKWKEFLLSPDFGFRYIVGVSGTCYVADEYFADVVFRYSLRQAIEDRIVKKVEYVAEMPATDSAEEKWQLIFKRHQDWKKKLKPRAIRPLTIVVTKAISDCQRVAEEVQAMLQELENLKPEEASERVLVVTSASKHQPNIAKLKIVDSPFSPVEWIVSVSMLSEGWDVKNVFQIVPHEERAFNSKLLIAQVLGRGLRYPFNWQGPQPTVTVFNHDAWSGRIRHLVSEILEIERRISSFPTEGSEFNFDLYTLDYTRNEDTTEFAKKGQYELFQAGYIDLPTQLIQEQVSIEFETALTGERKTFKTQLDRKTYSVEEVAEQMFYRLQSIDDESKDAEDPEERTTYAQKYPRSLCEQVVRESLTHAQIPGDLITEDNRQKLLQSLGTLRRKAAKRVLYRLTPNALKLINTRERHTESSSSADLRRGDKTIFFDPQSEGSLPDEQLEFFKELLDQDGEYIRGRQEVPNSFDFRTPLNIAIADGTPERKFVRLLCERDNAQTIDAWIKNTPQRFYTIEYAFRRRDHTKRGEFSPDFFIKQKDWIFVVEIKEDEECRDPSPENSKKFEYATSHFRVLNEWLTEAKLPVRYQFNFLTPKDYNKFFQKMREEKLVSFTSALDVALKTAAEA